MAYTKQNFQSGDVLYAAQLNAMDTEIKNVSDAIADLTYKEITVTSFSASPSQAEMGSTVSAVTLAYVINKLPETLLLDGTSQAANTSGSIALTGLSLTANKTYTLTATDERNATATKTTSVSFLNRAYYGVAAEPESVNSAFLLGLTNKVLTGSRSRSITVNANTGEYIWYAVPTRLGACGFKVGGFDGGFTLASTFSHTNASGYTENYNVYRSDNVSLGNTTVEVS